jgi:hypothetical protein
MEKLKWVILDVNDLHEKFDLSSFLEGINREHLLRKKENWLNGVAVLIDKSKINYMKTKKFFNSGEASKCVKRSVCLYMNKNSNTCDINLDDMRVGIDKKCIKCISDEIKKIIRIRCNIPKKNIYDFLKKIKMLIGTGFINPILVRNKDCNLIVMNKKKDDIRYDSSVFNECIDLVVCSKKKENLMHIKIEKNSINMLKNTPFSKCTLNVNKSCTQKEMAGALNVLNVNDRGIYTIGIDKNSVIYGTEEGVKIVNGKYNFHSHPKEAYIKYEVEDGIPSAQDYIGYMSSVYSNNSRCHFVAAIEGLYIISISKDFTLYSDIKNIIEDKIGKNKLYEFIKNKYNENKIKYNRVSDYVKIINKIKYNGRRIFKVKFYKWNYLADTNIKIYYLSPEINLYE